MKYVKKFASVLLALGMVFSLAITASAAETHTYEVYQIFTGDYSDGVLSNVKWGENGTGTKGAAVDQSILDELVAVNSASDTEKLAVIKNYAKLDSTAFTSGAGPEFSVTNGYYLVKDQAGTQDDAAYTLYVTQVTNGTLKIEPKENSVPTAVKKIVEGDSSVTSNSASIGDTVNYEITGTLPEAIDVYNTYYYVFTDTLSKGLTFKNDVTVTIGDVDVTSYFYVAATTYSETSGTTITVGIQDIKALDLLDGVTVDKASTIVVTYSATLNANAVIAGNGNANDVVLEYSNDPNNSGTSTTTPPAENPTTPPTTDTDPGTPGDEIPTGETPESEVKTYTTELTITKTDESGNILTGAGFTLTDADGKTVGSGEVDENGQITFSGLGDGTYTITETTTPAGYNTIAPITFTLTFDADTKAFSSNNANVGVGEDNKLDATIVNKRGSTLPSTGGIGTTIFYIVGSILVAGAVILLVTKKRVNSEK